MSRTKAGGRPKGELRIAIAGVFEAHRAAGKPGGLTWRGVAQALQARGLVHIAARSEMGILRRTLGNMQRDGDLMAIGTEQLGGGSGRPMTVFVLVSREQEQGAAALLGSTLRGWFG